MLNHLLNIACHAGDLGVLLYLSFMICVVGPCGPLPPEPVADQSSNTYPFQRRRNGNPMSGDSPVMVRGPAGGRTTVTNHQALRVTH